MRASSNRGYKRSWRNYLLSTRYQLQFTLFMVAISALLMALLGRYVMQSAEEATRIALDNVGGAFCKDPALAAQPVVVILDEGPAAPVDAPARADDPAPVDEPVAAQPAPVEEPVAVADEVAAPVDKTPAAEPLRRPVTHVEIEQSEIHPVVPAAALVRYHMCKLQENSTVESLRAGQDRVLGVLVVAGIALCLGLTVYGIKMTHRVAGPLHKVTLYFAKMRDDRFDTVYDLRKGDQLVEFYEHFKEAHAGIKAVEDADRKLVTGLLAEAEEAGHASRSPEIRAELAGLAALLEPAQEGAHDD
jgi:hypothetical protein